MFIGNKAKHKIIGICTSSVQSDYVREIVSSISRNGINKGYKILLFNTFSDLYHNTAYMCGEASIFDLINYDILDVLIIMPEAIKRDNISREIKERASEHGVPVICVDRLVENCCSVIFNYTDVFEKIVRHVVEYHDCKRVNFIAGVKGNSFSEERVDVYKKVLAENGIKFEPERLGYGDFWDVPARRVLQGFIDSELEFPEAIICANDSMAIAVCSMLKEMDIKVPEDVIVTGFDGIDLEKYNSPRLTTAAADIEVLGEKVIEAVDGLMNGTPLPEKIEIDYTMRISQSCGCEKIDPRQVGDKIMELYRRMNESDGHELHMFSYLAKTVECHTVEEMAKVMSKSGDYYNWVCTNSDFLSNTKQRDRFNESYTKQMRVFMQAYDGKYKTGEIFDTKDLLPDMEKVLDRHDCIMFSPLHFQDEVIGYAANSFSPVYFLFQNTRRFINNTNQIMESFKNRQRLEKANAELARIHMLDPMTGIYNRRGFYKNIRKLMTKAEKQGIGIAVFSIDMDNLKGINDRYGHNEGDKAIKALSVILTRCTSGSGICSRFGGDEFVVVISDINDAERFYEKIIHGISEYNRRSKSVYDVVISCGYKTGEPKTLKELDELLKESDKEMYAQKRQHHRCKD